MLFSQVQCSNFNRYLTLMQCMSCYKRTNIVKYAFMVRPAFSITPLGRPPLPEVAFVSADQYLFDERPDLYEQAFLGVVDVLGRTASRPAVQLVGHTWGEGAYNSVEWFTDESRVRIGNRHPQILWEDMRDALVRDPTRHTIPHLGHMLLSEDMTSRDDNGGFNNFLLGHTHSHQAVQSVARYLAADLPPRLQRLVTRQQARHETGHNAGLNGATILNRNTTEGLEEGHCTNVCTMQQSMSVDALVDLAIELADKPNAGFCGDCTTYIKER
jgi:hypothetical protein